MNYSLVLPFQGGGVKNKKKAVEKEEGKEEVKESCGHLPAMKRKKPSLFFKFHSSHSNAVKRSVGIKEFM